jgi:hypothetical protein
VWPGSITGKVAWINLIAFWRMKLARMRSAKRGAGAGIVKIDCMGEFQAMARRKRPQWQ